MINRALCVGIAVAFLLCVYCTSDNDSKQNVDTHTVGYVNLRDVIRQTGDVRPVLKIDLKSEASGTIKKLYVKEGQILSRGDTILTIDPQRLLYQKQRSDLSVRQEEIAKDKVFRELEQNKALFAIGSISDKALKDLQSEYDLSEISLMQKVLEQKDLLDQLGKTVVRSPMNGVLTALNVEEGEIAVAAINSPTAGTDIGTISNVSRLEVVSKIGEVDYVHLKENDKVTIIPESFDKTKTTGIITFIAKSAKKQNGEELGTFEVRIAVDSVIAGIAPGINVNVEFVVLDKKHVIGIPCRFITNKGDKAFVLLAGSGAKAQPVEKEIVIGQTDYLNCEVVSGLTENDVIIMALDESALKGDKNKKQRTGGFGNVGRLSGRR